MRLDSSILRSSYLLVDRSGGRGTVNTRYLILAVNLCWVLTTPAPLRRARTTLFTLVALSLLLEKCLCDDADRTGTISLVGRSGLVGWSRPSVVHVTDACCRIYNVTFASSYLIQCGNNAACQTTRLRPCLISAEQETIMGCYFFSYAFFPNICF